MKTKRLKYNDKNYKKVNKCQKVYLVGYWARYGVREYAFAGEFVDNPYWYKEPLVWYEEDHNGTYYEYVLKPISETTIGDSIIYCFNKELAQQIADKFNGER